MDSYYQEKYIVRIVVTQKQGFQEMNSNTNAETSQDAPLVWGKGIPRQARMLWNHFKKYEVQEPLSFTTLSGEVQEPHSSATLIVRCNSLLALLQCSVWYNSLNTSWLLSLVHQPHSTHNSTKIHLTVYEWKLYNITQC